MTDKLQLMLINVPFDQFLNIKVSQGSVATRLVMLLLCVARKLSFRRSHHYLNDQYSM